ncbi:hypothetical protein PC9H_008298 [Pleurotus ostreatus]|uniref:D-lactate dehydrogenase (cytochrome) n=1 Tax=Pleurotus ostreatus TaxID=5322 RepID=A0A8H6ZSY7_PLEOS|nr:uncharacterized protein PC9H_008298 [Pleurotus ostreatus]KAF7425936.1 hypothetical protein PC9H_008298 [Pleurotus ostreatus]
MSKTNVFHHLPFLRRARSQGIALGNRRLYSNASGTSALTRSHITAWVLTASLAAGIAGYKLGHIGASSTFTSYTIPGEKPRFGTPRDFQLAVVELKRAFASDSEDEAQVSTDPEELERHGFSMYDYHPSAFHNVVVYPRSTEDVVKIVNIARKYLMPVIPYSGGTSVEGHTRGHSTGGICVDMSQMDAIIEIHEQDSDLVCQPGCQWMAINEALQKKGIPLFFPLDPGPGATIGGMLSTGCSGTNAVRYGTARGEWFLNATVVLPSGEVIKTRSRARKSSAGFDLTKLFIGAEGTLGIVTEVTIRLAPVLPTTVAIVHFPDVKQATEAVTDALNQGVGIQCAELVDDRFMHATNLNGMSMRKWPERDSVFFKFQGPSPAALRDTAQVVKRVVERHGGFGFTLAKDEKEAGTLWADRKNALFSTLALVDDPNVRILGTDVCVPVSNLPQLVLETKEDLARNNILFTIVGHVGDGNFHAAILLHNTHRACRRRRGRPPLGGARNCAGRHVYGRARGGDWEEAILEEGVGGGHGAVDEEDQGECGSAGAVQSRQGKWAFACLCLGTS